VSPPLHIYLSETRRLFGQGPGHFLGFFGVRRASPLFFFAGRKNKPKSFAGSGKLRGLLPGDKARVWDDTLDVPTGKYTLGLRVPNRLKNGPALRFANKAQGAAAKGWLTLAELE
jgi:hypothetical protein